MIKNQPQIIKAKDGTVLVPIVRDGRFTGAWYQLLKPLVIPSSVRAAFEGEGLPVLPLVINSTQANRLVKS